MKNTTVGVDLAKKVSKRQMNPRSYLISAMGA
ncbi:MAG: hypothetical protein ACJAT1_002291 [Marivirga sp.]|jgi:hypothetical protein